MKKKRLVKKALAWVLTLATVVSVVAPCANMVAHAEPDQQTASMHEGEIVANNYDLSDAEKALLASGLLIGNTHTYRVPDSKDSLISVDTDQKKIVVQDYEGTTGYVWKAVSVDIVVGTEVKESVSISNNEGYYHFDGNAFSVVAEYALDIEVAAETQKTLLSAPQYLVDGLTNVKDIYSIKDNLGFAEEAIDSLVLLATTGYPVDLFGTPLRVLFEGDDTRASAIALEKQTLNNNGKLDLTVMLEEYETADSKVQYLVENGAALKAKAEETKQHIANIYKDNVWNLINSASNKDELTILFVFRDSLEETVDALTAATEKEWDALTKTFLKTGITDKDYAKLDTLVGAIAVLTDVSGVEIKNPLRVATTKIQHNMSMFDVSVKVVLHLTDANSTEIKYYEYGSKSTKITLAEGATKSEILSAIAETNIEAMAKDEWVSKYVDGKFTASVSDLPDALNSDIEYVITYYPNLYDVTFGYGELGTVSYPYGYVIRLERHNDELKAYDYTINGNYYAQGSTYTVEDTANIARKEGKSYEFSSIYQIVADNYLSEDGKTILTSGALLGDVAVNVRYPDNTTGIVSLSANVLTAANYSASYEGLFWKPYSCTLSNGHTYFFNGQNTLEINESFDKVTVNYRLYLTNFSEEKIIEIANIANVLYQEAKAQIEALNRISAQKGNLETLNRTMVNILAGLIEETRLHDDEAKDAQLKKSFGDVLAAIQAESMGTTNLYLFDIVNEYTGANDGLLYYYANHAKIRNEISKMAGFMSDMLGEDGTLSADDKIGALERLIRSLPSNIVSPDKVDEYVSKLTTLETTMSSVKESLSAPNSRIDLNSNNLGSLTSALRKASKVEAFETLTDGVHLEDSSIIVVPANKTAVTITLQIEGGNNATVASNAVFVDEVIDANFVNDLKTLINTKLTELSVNGKYYNTTYNEDVFHDMIGQQAGSLEVTAYEFVWTYKSFVVEVPGTSDQTVSYSNRVILLPACTDAAYRYDYYINGVKISDATYNLSMDDLDKVIDGKFKVEREVVYVLRENLVNYVNSLNNAIASDMAVFALVENAGNFSIILKIDAAQPDALAGAIQGMAMGMVRGAYPYVGIDNNGFLADGSIYLQTLIDAFANSGFGTDSMLKIVDAKGNINNMTITGNVISDKSVTSMGGQLMGTTIQLGTTAQDVQSLPFYVTLGSVGQDFVNIRNFFEENFASYMTFVCEDGAFNVSFNLPQKMYEALLAALLVTENLSLDDINAVNGQITVTFINDLLMPLFKGDVTVETFDNTFSQFGYSLDLSSHKGAESLFSFIKSFYADLTFNHTEFGTTTTGNVGISSLIDSMNVGVLGNIIAEKETGLNINLGFTLEDLGTDYEAIYVDVDAKGLANKVGLVADLQAKLGEISGPAVIVLLKDVNADLTFKGTSILNLNGFTVQGGLNAVGNTVVIDSSIDNAKNGAITGNITGNAILVGGKYSQDVTAYLKNGFVQKADGVVTNKYYSISKNANNEVIVSLNASEFASFEEMPNVTALALDLACELLFNGYSSNYLELDGNMIYNLTLNDIVGIYAGTNRLDSVINEVLQFVDSEQLSAFINTVIDDVTDFAAIRDAIENSTPVLEYAMATKPWKVELAHIADGNYISSNVVSGSKTNNSKIKVYVEGEEAHKDYLVDLFEELSNTISADVDVSVSHGKEDNKINITASVDASVIVDWSNPDYAVMFSIIAANGLKSTARDNLVAGIREYYTTGNIAALRLAFNSLTNAQLIEAVKVVSRNASFTQMIQSLELADVVDADVVKLEALFDKFGKVAAYIVRESGLTGGTRTIASFLDSDGYYGMSRENIEKLYNHELFRGYLLNVKALVENATIKIKLFSENAIEVDYTELNNQIGIAQGLNKDDYTEESWAVLEDALEVAIKALNATTQDEVDAAAKALKDAIAGLTVKSPEFVNETGDASLSSSDKIAAYAVDANKKVLYLDTDITGITVDTLQSLLKFTALNADSIEIMIGDGTLSGDALVTNGTKIKAVARRNGTDVTDEVELTVIILGDVNDNGRIDIGDAVVISQLLVGDTELSEILLLAADTNCNGRTDIGDATRIAGKIVDWSSYESMIGKQ